MTQLALPVTVTPDELGRQKTLGDAIELCIDVAGLEPKQVGGALKWDKAQWSRWTGGQEGVVWPKLQALMDHCGNDSPVLWMLMQRGYDLASLRKKESELERQLRMVIEENQALRRVLQASSQA
jgi:plasmid maintenance system antidote protein VapI